MKIRLPRVFFKLTESSALRNIITLMTGNSIAQILVIGVTPILTRIYSPEDFGLLALFVSFVAIFGAIANGRYELAIALPAKEEDAINVTVLGIFISFVLSIVILFAVLLFGKEISGILGQRDIQNWLYLTPFTIFLVGLYNSLRYYNIRHKEFSRLAKVVVQRSTLGVSTQLGLGFLLAGPAGLIIGNFLSNAAGTISLTIAFFRNYKQSPRTISVQSVGRVALRYINFPKYSMWSILANTLATNLTIFFISVLYSSTLLGYYAMIMRILTLPGLLLGSSVGDVFFKRATEEKQQTGRCDRVLIKTIGSLSIVSISFSLPFYFIAEDAFRIVLGTEWEIAGTYAKILLPLFAIQMVVSPVSTINMIFEKQKTALSWQLLLLFTSLAVFWVAKFLQLDFASLLKLYTVTISFCYILLAFIVYGVSRGR